MKLLLVVMFALVGTTQASQQFWNYGSEAGSSSRMDLLQAANSFLSGLV